MSRPQKNKKIFPARRLAVVCILVSVAAWILFCFYIGPVPSDRSAFLVKVLLAETIKNAVISAPKIGQIIDLNSHVVIKEGTSFDNNVFFAYKSSVIMDITPLNTSRVRLIPAAGATIKIDNNEYRGEIDVYAEKETLTIINRVDLEDYLKGVLPGEMNRLWPFETQKAQAIVSRSYAAHLILKKSHKDYDLKCNTFSQVYCGKTCERVLTSLAVDKTRDMILSYDGKILPGYFHSTCGGHTESAKDMWGEKDTPPLRGVKCENCKWSPYYSWKVGLTPETISTKLVAAGYKCGKIDDIRASEYTGSGRVKFLGILSGDALTKISASQFISIMGNRLLRSTKFTIEKWKYHYNFCGNGWGHGVGMCQWGAFKLGIKFKKCSEILAYYYPGAKVADLVEVLRGYAHHTLPRVELSDSPHGSVG
ncbi:MAG: SpoIID/LytB domain-containing protein [Candidatus Omnitrophica bacterium]|nr:SpoIID/LytB domain-containing protein [Candidatus Omnitrophota bacterium]